MSLDLGRGACESCGFDSCGQRKENLLHCTQGTEAMGVIVQLSSAQLSTTYRVLTIEPGTTNISILECLLEGRVIFYNLLKQRRFFPH